MLYIGRAPMLPARYRVPLLGFLSIFKSAAAMEREGETLAEWLGACALVRFFSASVVRAAKAPFTLAMASSFFGEN
jgi:hypothetical protein